MGRYSYDLEVRVKELEDRESVLRSQLQKMSFEKEALQKVVDNVWKLDEEKEKYTFSLFFPFFLLYTNSKTD